MSDIESLQAYAGKLSEAAAQAKESAGKQHEYIHGSSTTDVVTESGPVPSLAKQVVLTQDKVTAALEEVASGLSGAMSFTTIAKGLLATNSGELFGVLSPVDKKYVDIYENVANVAVPTGKSYPSAYAYDSITLSLGVKADVVQGKNLFNPADQDVALGSFPSNMTGLLQANVGYNTSGYIPVAVGGAYTLSTKHYTAWYTAAKVFISGTSAGDANKTIVAPAGAAFLRCSAAVGNEWKSFQVEAGSAATPFESFGKWIMPQSIKSRSLSADKLVDKAVTPEKVSFVQLGKNLFDKTAVTLGKLMDSAGVLSSSANYNVSDYISVTPGAQYFGRSASVGMRFTTFFSVEKVVVAGGSNSDVSGFTVPAGVAYVRISVYASSQDSFQLEMGAAATWYENFKYTLKFADGRTVYATPEDGSIATNKLADSAVTPEKVNFLKKSKNLFDLASVTIGNFMGAGGALTPNAAYNVSDYIPVTPGAQYVGLSAQHGMRMLTYFSAAKTVVPGGSDNNISTFTVPAGVAYVRVSVFAISQGSFQLEVGAEASAYAKFGYTLIATIRVEGSSVLWEGKRWSTLGDSITAAGLWQAIVSAKLGLSHTNFGIGGTKLSGVDANAMCQDIRINAIPATQDLVTVMGGTNDWAQNVPLGATDSTDPLTFYGALNTLVSKLMARFPGKRVALFTTPYGEFIDFASRGWSNAYTNTQGLTTRDYAEAVRVVCKRWGLPCVDVQSNAGWNALNIRTYLNDDGALLHPNSIGAGRVAEVVIGFFRGIEPLA